MTRHLLALVLLLSLAMLPISAQPPRYEPGVLAVRNEASRWELVHVLEGDEVRRMSMLAANGQEVVRLHVLTLQSDPIWIPMVMRDHDPRVPTDPLWSQQWGTQAIGVRRQDGSDGPIVAVLDSGFHLDVEDPPALVPGVNEVDGNDDPYHPSANHGTHVATTLAAPHNRLGIAGVCGNCRIMVVQVCGWMFCQESDIADGIYYAMDHGADIISMSLAGRSDMPYLHQVVQDAYAAGLVIVAAAGNDGTSMPQYPAGWDETVAVSNVAQDMKLAYDSNVGKHIDFAGPGMDIIAACSPPNGYCMKCGTSMATPHVSGAFGVVFAAHPDWTREQAYDYLAATALDLGEPSWDEEYGWGLVQVPREAR